MAETCIVGIDPGLSGALAFYFPSSPELIAVEDMPLVAGEVDVVTLKQRLQQMGPTVAIVERVWARMHDSRSSAFKFGGAYFAVRSMLVALEVPHHLVTPQRWKKHFSLDNDKDKSRALALRYWPSSTGFSRKKDHGRAEAALLARYGAEVPRP